MAAPKKLPSGQWRARGYYKDPITGKEYRPSFTAASKAEVSRMVLEWESQKHRASVPMEMTVGECISRYITVKESALSPSTIRGYRRMERNHYSKIGGIAIKSLTDEDMQSFISNMCIGHSPKTVRNAYALLVASVGMFTDRRYHVTLPQKLEIERHIPTDEQVSQLISKADPTLKKAIILGAFAACRQGEVCALLYRDVDFSNNTIHVHADMVKDQYSKWIIKPAPKTSSSDRYIPVSQKVIDALGNGDPDEPIYGRTPAAINRAFVRLRDKLGLKCRYHDLRHYAASMMHAIGIPDQYIQQRCGWSSDAVLKNVYRNTLSDQSKLFQDKANDHFDTLF